jgi:hypothetical protein
MARVFHSTIGTGSVLNVQRLTIFYGKGALTMQEGAVSATRILWGQIVMSEVSQRSFHSIPKPPRSLKVSNYEANYQTVLCVSVFYDLALRLDFSCCIPRNLCLFNCPRH